MEAVAKGARPGMTTGIKALWGGVAWLAKTPDAWPLAAVPIALGTIISAALTWMSIAWVPDMVAEWVGPTESALAGFGAFMLELVSTLVAILLAVLIGFTLAQPLSGSALEGLVRRQERELGVPERAKTSFLHDVWCSLQSLLISGMFGLPALAILLVLSIVVPAAGVVLFPLKLMVAAIIIAWDLCDYPLTVRGLPVGRRISVMLRHFPAILGFALGMALASLVPCLGFLLLPSGVAGAARLMLEIERWEAAEGRAIDGVSGALA